MPACGRVARYRQARALRQCVVCWWLATDGLPALSRSWKQAGREYAHQLPRRATVPEAATLSLSRDEILSSGGGLWSVVLDALLGFLKYMGFMYYVKEFISNKL